MLLTHKFFIDCTPAYFYERLIIIDHDERLLNVWYHTSVSGRSFSYAAPRFWNCLPREIWLLNDTDRFEACIKTMLFTNSHNILQASLGYCTYYWNSGNKPLQAHLTKALISFIVFLYIVIAYLLGLVDGLNKFSVLLYILSLKNTTFLI